MKTNLIVKKSTIRDCNGLFTNENIQAGKFVCKIDGKFKKNKELTDKDKKKLIIMFDHDNYLVCNNLVNFIQDIIEIPTQKRNIKNIIDNNESFYNKMNINLNFNVELLKIPKMKCAYIKATSDIKAGSELFIHHGIYYWIKKESLMSLINQKNNSDDTNQDNKLDDSNQDNKLDDTNQDNNFKIPFGFFRTKSFKKYVKTFYPLTDINNMYVSLDKSFNECVKLVTQKNNKDNKDNNGFILDMKTFGNLVDYTQFQKILEKMKEFKNKEDTNKVETSS